MPIKNDEFSLIVVGFVVYMGVYIYIWFLKEKIENDQKIVEFGLTIVGYDGFVMCV